MGIIDGKTINVSTIDRTFIAANVELENQDENPDNLLCRFEFIELFLRLSDAKYRQTKLVKTVSEAFKKLLEDHILPYHGTQKHLWQSWRDKYLWRTLIDELLLANKRSLE